MKGLTKTTLWEFLIFLQEMAKYNVTEIKQNLDKIKDCTYLMNNNIESKDLIKRLTKKNEEIRKENSKLLTLHNFILQINEKEAWHNREDVNQIEVIDHKSQKPISKDEYIQRILNNEIDLNSDNSCLENEEILNSVFKVLLDSERYEECEIINKRKEGMRKFQNSSTKSQGKIHKSFKFNLLKDLRKRIREGF